MRREIACGIGVALAAGLATPASAQQDLLTRPERTAYRETSRYEDVIRFVDAVVASSPDLHRMDFGFTMEGRALPLVAWAPGADASRFTSPPMLQRAFSDKTRVLIFANIHAGEVEGKEAAQILLRELAAGEHAAWADSLLVIVVPIYNADGNERVRLDNRTLQHGPLGGMGQRPNAQGLDLNRDFMKLESPEARSLVGLMRDADPHVVIDLHTTNGSFHAYHLTYAPPLHPDTDPAISRFLRDELLPEVTRALEAGPRAWLTQHYADLAEDTGEDLPHGWYTFDSRPRFSTNYAGLRNRLGILSEAYAYLPFEPRIAVTHDFVVGILDVVHARASAVRRLTEAADARPVAGTDLAIAAEHAPTGEEDILLGAVDTVAHPFRAGLMLERRDVVRPERMPTFTAFRATATAAAPAAYLVPAALWDAIGLLRAHGVWMEPLGSDRTLAVEEFRIAASRQEEEEFQGHRQRALEGEWVAVERPVPAGTLVVPVDQPLARLVFHLLDPRAPDGLVNWNVLDPALEGAAVYPILRSRTAVVVP